MQPTAGGAGQPAAPSGGPYEWHAQESAAADRLARRRAAVERALAEHARPERTLVAAHTRWAGHVPEDSLPTHAWQRPGVHCPGKA